MRYGVRYTLTDGTQGTVDGWYDEEHAGRLVAELRRCVDVAGAEYFPL